MLAECELQIQTINAEIMQLRRTNDAQIQQEVGKYEAEAEAYECSKVSNGMMESAAKVSEGRKELALAEGASVEFFAARREQELEMKQLEVLDCMAINEDIRIVTSLENNMGLAPGNSLVTQATQQGLEAFRMKLAEVTANSTTRLEMGKTLAGGLVRPVPQQQMMLG